MRRFLVILLFPLSTMAHPGIGIVQDSQGAVYYTDLQQVWRIKSDGQKEVAVPHVHTHELYIDSNDNLYGEHLWYNGERENTWGHYVWRFSSRGVLDTLEGPKEGFLEDYSFVRDGAGNMYWVERNTVSRFKKRAPDGTIALLAEGKFKNVRWIHATQEGILYFTDLTDLYQINRNGSIKLLVKDITQQSAGFAGAGRTHALFGIWTDGAGLIYVADFSDQVVKRITPNGRVENLYHSNGSWSPTGGLFDREGNLWLLEVSRTKEVRVRKIGAAELSAQQRGSGLFSNYLLAVLAVLVALTLLFFVSRIVIWKLRSQAA